MELTRLVNHIRQSVEFSKHSIPIKRKSPDAANHTVKNGCHSTPLQKFMLPSDIESLCGSVGEEADDNFKNLVGETLDILDSDDCQNVLKMCLDAGFAHVLHNMIPFFQVEELGELRKEYPIPLKSRFQITCKASMKISQYMCNTKHSSKKEKL